MHYADGHSETVYPAAPKKVWHGKMSVKLYTKKDVHYTAFGQAGFNVRNIELLTEVVKR